MQIDLAPSCLSRLLHLDNPHRDRLAAYFGALDRTIRPPRNEIAYLFILFTNRCGSNYLAQLLASTGRFNEAGEYFNAETVLHHARRHRLRALPDYLDFLNRCVAMHGRLVVKLGIEHLALLAEAGLLQAMLPRAHLVLFEREDRLGQAISRAIACQNLRWTSRHQSALPDDQLRYSRSLIKLEWDKANLGNYLLRYVLGDLGVAACCTTYEDLLADPQAVIARIGAHVGERGLQIAPSRVSIERQATSLNEAWRTWYLRGE